MRVVGRQHVRATSRNVRLLHNLVCLTGHSVRAQLTALRHDVGVAWLPYSETFLGVTQCLSSCLRVGVRRAFFARHNGSVVEQVDELACLGCEQNLLLGALDDGSSVNIVGLLELLAGDVGELGLGDERLGFGADEFLLESD